MQETFQFDDTIRANLALHDDGLTQERLQWAARMACVEDVIGNLPQGFDSRVGENGSLLSGGQRQRLSLARALAHDPAILLLDEATSSLDLETEARIHGNLARLGCTRILIAHRLATVRDADRPRARADDRDPGRFGHPGPGRPAPERGPPVPGMPHPDRVAGRHLGPPA